MPDNFLYFGDNLSVLRERIVPESIDLVYLDPPFNSNVDYNVLFAERDGTRAAAQIRAFTDTWRWDESAAAAYDEVAAHGGPVARLMASFQDCLGRSDMMAYLAFMSLRLVELHRVLRPTGTLYLHCDPTASHYLKLVLDAVFGPKRFLNEVSWKRSSAHNDIAQGMRRMGRIRDVILVYAKGENHTWNATYTPYEPGYLESEYRHVAPNGRRFKQTDLTAARPGGDTEYEWRVKRAQVDGSVWAADLDEEFRAPHSGWEYRGVRPYNGRYWAYSRANMIEFARGGRLFHRKTGMPRLIQFADEMPGVPLQDAWNDILPVAGGEALGYPTQKPQSLLERIIQSSSRPGDVVLDPFCGCGTAVHAAQANGRRWVGIDITFVAISHIKNRLETAFGPAAEYHVDGLPASVADAQELAREDRFQFQWWALTLVNAGGRERKRGADHGVDGRLFFETGHGRTGLIVISVKSGQVSVRDVRELDSVVRREKAEIGALITLQEPTGPMRREAAGEYYESAWGRHPRLQILTIEQLLAGGRIDYPRTAGTNVTLKAAARTRQPLAEPLLLPLAEVPRRRAEHLESSDFGQRTRPQR